MDSFIKKKALFSLIGSALIAIPSLSWSIDKPSPEFFQVGDFFLIPSVSLTEGYDDNLFLQNTDEVDTWKMTLNPKMRLAYEGDYSLSALDVALTKGIYHSSSDDNYLDSSIKVGTEMYPSKKVKYGASIAHMTGHDARGTGLQDGLSAFDFTSPHEYKLTQALADFEYGTRVEGAARLEFEFSYDDKKYTNHRGVTTVLDRETGSLTAGLAYMLAPATAILIEGKVSDIDYDTATLDSEEYQVMVGLEWAATYQTTGFLKVGVSEKDFSNPARADADEPAWEIGVDWSPLTYSTVTVRTAKGFSEGEGTGNFMNAQVFGIDWAHDWYDHIGTRVTYETQTDEYGNSAREDDTDTLTFGGDFQYNPWLLISADYKHQERDSNSAALDYKDNIVSLTLGVNL